MPSLRRNEQTLEALKAIELDIVTARAGLLRAERAVTLLRAQLTMIHQKDLKEENVRRTAIANGT